jgi:hypothetical protein
VLTLLVVPAMCRYLLRTERPARVNAGPVVAGR